MGMNLDTGQWEYDDNANFETNFSDWYICNRSEYKALNIPYPYSDDKAKSIFVEMYGYKNNTIYVD